MNTVVGFLALPRSVSSAGDPSTVPAGTSQAKETASARSELKSDGNRVTTHPILNSSSARLSLRHREESKSTSDHDVSPPSLPGQDYLPDEALGDPCFSTRPWLVPACSREADSHDTASRALPRSLAEPVAQLEQNTHFLQERGFVTRAAGATGSDSTLPVLSPTQLISQLLRSLYDENHMGEMLKRLFTQRYANGAFDHS